MCWFAELDELLLSLSLFLFVEVCLSFVLDLCEPLDDILDPEVSKRASLFATFWGEPSSVVSLSGGEPLRLTGL